MMASTRTILVADPDRQTRRDLEQALSEDYDVLLASDGSRALETAVLEYPSLILFYRHCPLLGARQFSRILRANPRTEEIPLVVLADEPMAAEARATSFQAVLVKPLNMDEVRSRVAAVFRRMDTVRQVGASEGAINGTLEQISMADLLQIFSVNRRTGCLEVTEGPEAASAEIYLAEGRIEDAQSGAARGAKALYRLLAWDSGRFVFLPGRRSARKSLNDSTDSLLMEGLRQIDELARLWPSLPGRNALLERLVPRESLPEGLHPVTAEIYQLAEVFPRVSDLTDRAAATDMEVAIALKSLIQAGLIRPIERESERNVGALLQADEVLELRSRLRRAGLPPAYAKTFKVAVMAADPADLWSFARALARLQGFEPVDLRRVREIRVGALGALALDATMKAQVFAVPADERLLPLSFALSAGTVAAIVIGTGNNEELERQLSLMESVRRAPLLFVRRPGEPLHAAGERHQIIELDDLSLESCRQVMRALLKRVAGSDLRGGSL